MSAQPSNIVDQLQFRIQQQYDLTLPYEVVQFVSHDAVLAQYLAEQEQPTATADTTTTTLEDSERVFICQTDDTLEFTLYLDEAILASVNHEAAAKIQDPLHQVDTSLDDLCTIMEGVSHAVCLLWHAHHDRQIRPVELELQAEIDKYFLLLKLNRFTINHKALHRQLFSNCRYLSGQNEKLHTRYKQANDCAADYCQWLTEHFVEPLDEQGLDRELARFYRLSGVGKFERIRRLH